MTKPPPPPDDELETLRASLDEARTHALESIAAAAREAGRAEEAKKKLDELCREVWNWSGQHLNAGTAGALRAKLTEYMSEDCELGDDDPKTSE